MSAPGNGRGETTSPTGNDANSANDPDGNGLPAALTGGQGLIDISYTVDSNTTYDQNTWVDDIAVAEYAGTTGDGQVKWSAFEIDVPDLDLAADSVYFFQVSLDETQTEGVVINTFSHSNPVSTDELTWAAEDSSSSNTIRSAMWQFEYEIVPEPMTMSLLTLGGLGALLRRRRR